MKKLIFALPLLALALTLTYCAKDNTSLTEATDQTPATNSGATDRAICTINIASDQLVSVCGLANNQTACLNCLGLSKGYSVGINQVFVIDDTVYRNFYITNISGVNGAQVTIQTSAGVSYCFYLHPNESRCFGTGNCMLVADRAPDC